MGERERRNRNTAGIVVCAVLIFVLYFSLLALKDTGLHGDFAGNAGQDSVPAGEAEPFDGSGAGQDMGGASDNREGSDPSARGAAGAGIVDQYVPMNWGAAMSGDQAPGAAGGADGANAGTGDVGAANEAAGGAPAAGQEVIQVDSVYIKADKTYLAQREQVQIYAEVLPLDATDRSLTWSTDDPDVAVVSADGLVTAVGGGVANIYATSSNGLDAELAIEVSQTKKRMTYTITSRMTDNDQVGDDWLFDYELNGASTGRYGEMTVEVGDTIIFEADITENDPLPDEADGEGTYTVTENGWRNGFWITLNIEVKENDGRFVGHSAFFESVIEFRDAGL